MWGEADVEIRPAAVEREDLAHQLVLLVLQDIGKRELVGEIAEVELRHRLAREPVVKPVDRRLEPFRNDFRRKPERIEHLDGRRVVGGGALVDEGLGQRLQRHERHALAMERQRQHHGDRPAAGDNDGITFRHVSCPEWLTGGA